MLRFNKNLTDLTKEKIRINLPLNHSFNGSIVIDKTGDGYILAFRINQDNHVYGLHKITSVVSKNIGICKLDKNFKYILNTLYVLKHNDIIDPRISWVDDKLLLVCTNDTNDKGIFGNIIMDLKISDSFIHSDIFRITPKEYPQLQKNWTSFIYNGELYFIKNITPHRIYKYSLETKTLTFISESNWSNKWIYDLEFRGNTNPVKLPDNNFLGTFHTTANITIGGIDYRFYDNGFYIFNGTPPFKPIKMLPQTFLPAESCDLTFNWKKNPYVNEHKEKFLCTFPAGMILNGDKIIISYGNSDKFIDIGIYSLKEIMDLMVDV
jgi:predicted GH43/DUF377 family glycosyl hydrolase